MNKMIGSWGKATSVAACTVAGIGAMTLGGCAAEVSESELITEDGEAISLDNGYGVDGNYDRCWFDTPNGKWGGNTCRIPVSKKINFCMSPGTCGGQFSADYAAAMSAAFGYVSNELAVQGWTVTNSCNTPAGSAVAGTVFCSTTGPFGAPAGSLGFTRFGHSPFVLPCSSTAHGSLCKIDVTDSALFPANIDGFLGGVVQSQRRVLLEDLFRHEMLHAAGLGHDLCGGNPVTNVMGHPSACQTLTNPQSWFKANLVKFERDMLFHYKP